MDGKTFGNSEEYYGGECGAQVQRGGGLRIPLEAGRRAGKVAGQQERRQEGAQGDVAGVDRHVGLQLLPR